MLEDYFSGFASGGHALADARQVSGRPSNPEPADLRGGCPPSARAVRVQYTKKTGRVIAKFDHYCYLLGNAVGEGNHGDFWRFLFVQV